MFTKIHLEPENKTFAEVMANEKSYEVPPFQRDYTWETEQLEELWQDIQHMQKYKNQHFMGYLVLKSKDNKFFQIIDGQQRITTITLLIIAILAKFNELIKQGIEPDENEKRKDVIHKRYLGVFNVVTLGTSSKLSLNLNNREHFSDIIDLPYGEPRKRGITATNRKLNKTFTFFSNKLSSHNSKALAELIEALGDGLLFTTITVSDDLNAFLVFETLNARGIHLSAPDLLKNHLLSTLNPGKNDSSIEDFETLWNRILEQLGETNFTAFLRSYEGMFSRLRHKKDLYRYLKMERIKSPGEVMPYIKDLHEHASVYASLQNPDDAFWKDYGDGQYLKCVEDLKVLKLFNIKTPLSLLMAAYKQFEPDDFNKLVKWLVAISVRYNVICQKPAKDQESTYNNLSMDIMNKKSSINNLKTELKTLYPPDDEFATNFARKSMPARQSGKKIIYLLKAISKQLNNVESPPENLTLEHVLPYNPADQWQEYFGRETWSEATDRLGNLALLPASQNRDTDQKKFEDKKKVLQESHIPINKNIASFPDWNIDTLNDHQKWLAIQAKTVWRIDW